METLAWALKFEQTTRDGTRQLGSDQVGKIWVSTVWIGIDAGPFDGEPLIFETAAFSEEREQLWCERAPTRVAALQAHAKAKRWAQQFTKEAT